MKKRILLPTCLRICLPILICWTLPSVSGGHQNLPKCNAICFRSAQYWLLNLNQLPSGAVMIGGVNFNTPINTNSVDIIQHTLKSDSCFAADSLPLQSLNREFVAAQLSLASAGGTAVAVNALWTPLSCYGLETPVSLGNGFVLTGNSMLKDLLMQARIAAANPQTPSADRRVLTALLKLINGNDPLGHCLPPGPGARGLEILATDSPVLEYDNRIILDRANIQFAKLNEWYSSELTGSNPDVKFLVKARHTGLFVEVELRVMLKGNLRNIIVTRNRSELQIKRLWISRGYIHGDLGRAYFPSGVAEDPKPFEGNLWFATLRCDSFTLPQITGESRRTYEYGLTTTGEVRLDLHGGYQFVRKWAIRPNGHDRDYITSWLRDGELLAETTESVFHIDGIPVSAGCNEVATGSYCDTPPV